ncbi:hypothetical protein O181_074332 [Austropuccinia psidii MF-1]|uniref:GDP-Man:Man(3)GlcNAc(2)-PP-Dol alpha-1,2-mannosyltransferase n=1 Tax=Austropuccinia psidii MF-1 TaxID=1389203 RepID=A0A9Q3FCV0_9BASI|nr:hypothetical protein [Austropuccinia psidii MF-1]
MFKILTIFIYSLKLILRLPPTLRLLTILTLIGYSVYLNIILTKFIFKRYSLILKRRNVDNRSRLLQKLGISEKFSREYLIIGFFHPYCNAGGGGERVLWTAVSFHQRTHPNSICAIYTGDLEVSKVAIIHKVKQRFGISLNPNSLLFLPLTTRSWVEASRWPRFTLLGQSLGSMVLGYEALSRLIPDIYLDTMGYAFTFPVFRLLSNTPIGAYVHYPTISNDMLQRVSRRDSAHNNSSIITNSQILSQVKLLYYLLFAELYSLCLRQADYLMVNSTWTKNHIDRLLKPWLHRDEIDLEMDHQLESCPSPQLTQLDGLRLRVPSAPSNLSSKHLATQSTRESKHKKSSVVYPPCDVQSFLNFPLQPRSPIILSISQFRPEKDQETQIKAFAQFLSQIKPNYSAADKIKLILAGSCRDQFDEDRVRGLQQLCKDLEIDDSVMFKVNVDWHELRQLLKESLVGLSTMVDEHFGISIVEFMASGLIPLVHKSGGPLLDIVVEHHEGITGFHAEGVKEYKDRLIEIFDRLGKDDEILLIRQRARNLSERKFQVENFEQGWLVGFENLQKRIEK